MQSASVNKFINDQFYLSNECNAWSDLQHTDSEIFEMDHANLVPGSSWWGHFGTTPYKTVDPVPDFPPDF
jgi:hypothetical protein